MRAYFLWLAKFLTVIFVFTFVVPIMLTAVLVAGKEAVKKGGKSADEHRNSKVAVVELTGVIDDSKEILKSLKEQVDSSSIKAVVLRINSPGGAVAPSQDIYDAVKRWKSIKPIVASMGTVAASGGLYSSLGASKVVAQPGTITGSIGVIMQLPNFEQVANKIGVSMVTIKSGALKDVGNAFRPMTEAERTYLQETIDAARNDFVQAVADGRKLDRANVEKFADGRIILGSHAKELGLVDEVGDVYTAARIALEIAGVKLGANELPELEYPKDKFEEFKKLLESFSNLIPNTQASIRLMYLM